MIPFPDSAFMRDLSRGEIVYRKLPIVWHGQIMNDFKVNSKFAGSFTVPRLFISDGASIPRVLWNMLSDTDPDILYPSYAHDFVYSVKGVIPLAKTISIHDADEMIRELMLAIHAPRWKADAVFRALRIWNGSKWKPVPEFKLAETCITK